MSKSNHDDISIGQDRWISFVDTSNRPRQDAVSIDPLLAPMEPFWSALETHCVAGCCGIEAFALWPDDIQSACPLPERHIVASALRSLQEFVGQSSADTFVSQRLNNLFDKKVLLELLQHLQCCLAADQLP